MLLHTTITRKWPSSCWTKERPHTQLQRYQETLTASVYWSQNSQLAANLIQTQPHAHTQTHTHTHKWWRNMAADPTAAHMLTQNHLQPTFLINFCHFTSSPPTVTSEDGKLFIALKRSCFWKRCTSVVDVVLIDCSGIVHLKMKVLS